MKAFLLGCAICTLRVTTAYAEYIDFTQGGVVRAQDECIINGKDYYCYVVEKDGRKYLLSQDDCGEHKIWLIPETLTSRKIATKDMKLIWTRDTCRSKWDLEGRKSD